MSGTGLQLDIRLVSVPPEARRMRLYVRILEARQLAVGDTSIGSSDPYAVAFVGESFLRTAVCKRTLAPKWEADATLDVPLQGSELARRALHVVVWDWDSNSSDDFLGEVLVPLAALDQLRQGERMDRWFRLTDKDGGTRGVSGSLRLELRAAVDEHEEASVGAGHEAAHSHEEGRYSGEDEEGEEEGQEEEEEEEDGGEEGRYYGNDGSLDARYR
jgi:hypothetical protein